MILCDVVITIIRRLEHGSYGVKSSPEHWRIRHLHSHTIHSHRIFWVHLKYSRLFGTALHEVAWIYSPRHELEVDVAAAPILAHICGG